MEELFMSLTNSVGPAIAFSYLMYKVMIKQNEQINTIIKDNTKAINKLAIIIAKIEGKLDMEVTEEREGK